MRGFFNGAWECWSALLFSALALALQGRYSPLFLPCLRVFLLCSLDQVVCVLPSTLAIPRKETPWARRTLIFSRSRSEMWQCVAMIFHLLSVYLSSIC